MSFVYTTLTVKDLEASLAFYTKIVGLPIDRRFPAGPGTEIAFLGAGETKVELVCYKNHPEPIIGNAVSLGFRVDSLPEKLSQVRDAGVPVISEIIQPNPHVRFFYVTDPDGFQVQFSENL